MDYFGRGVRFFWIFASRWKVIDFSILKISTRLCGFFPPRFCLFFSDLACNRFVTRAVTKCKRANDYGMLGRKLRFSAPLARSLHVFSEIFGMHETVLHGSERNFENDEATGPRPGPEEAQGRRQETAGPGREKLK
jgi:hypothetical protein